MSSHSARGASPRRRRWGDETHADDQPAIKNLGGEVGTFVLPLASSPLVTRSKSALPWRACRISRGFALTLTPLWTAMVSPLPGLHLVLVPGAPRCGQR